MARRSVLDPLLQLMLALSLGLGVVLPAASAANGLLKPHEGCAVVLAVDGDTVKLLCPTEGLVAATVRLDWRLLTPGHIAVSGDKTDRYGRRLVRLDLDGRDVAGPMIASGLARPYDGGPRAGWCG